MSKAYLGISSFLLHLFTLLVVCVLVLEDGILLRVPWYTLVCGPVCGEPPTLILIQKTLMRPPTTLIESSCLDSWQLGLKIDCISKALSLSLHVSPTHTVKSLLLLHLQAVFFRCNSLYLRFLPCKVSLLESVYTPLFSCHPTGSLSSSPSLSRMSLSVSLLAAPLQCLPQFGWFFKAWCQPKPPDKVPAVDDCFHPIFCRLASM